MSHCICS